MALLRPVMSTLLFALVLSGLELSTCKVMKGKVSCLDCSSNFDLSGIKVLVKCNKVKKLETAITETKGLFEVKIPSNSSAPPSPMNCIAKLLGGPTLLYASWDNMVSKVVQDPGGDRNLYTISTPLVFSTTCPLKSGKCERGQDIGSSKTVDLPLPREWGLAPSSYYIPFFPIIGIP